MSAETTPVLQVEGLAKTFRVGLLGRPVEAVRGISFRLEPGRVLGYLGPNGSGKTTSIKCMLGLIQPTAGKIAFFGRPHSDPLARARIGYMPEHPYFYDYLKPPEVLDYVGRLYGIPAEIRRKRSHELLERLGLGHAMDRTLRGFSKGMLQRVGIAQSLISDPDLVVYDEPLSGLDPIGRKELRDLMAELRAEGKALFVTSHVLSDIESFCDEVVILRKGVAVAQGRLEDLLRRDRLESSATLALPADAAADLGAQLATACGGSVTAEKDGKVTVQLPSDAVGALSAAAAELGATLVELHPVKDTLEELFVRQALAIDDAKEAR
ncbi:MAG: ABC transporter ATP-binding protein [Deltaproteobacteria bacterium]|nr:ABC transporter ATP-binding protein [Deltaproteobacteria bacterium]